MSAAEPMNAKGQIKQMSNNTSDLWWFLQLGSTLVICILIIIGAQYLYYDWKESKKAKATLKKPTLHKEAKNDTKDSQLLKAFHQHKTKHLIFIDEKDTQTNIEFFTLDNSGLIPSIKKSDAIELIDIVQNDIIKKISAIILLKIQGKHNIDITDEDVLQRIHWKAQNILTLMNQESYEIYIPCILKTKNELIHFNDTITKNEIELALQNSNKYIEETIFQQIQSMKLNLEDFDHIITYNQRTLIKSITSPIQNAMQKHTTKLN